jgi:hypothetical protein
VGWFFVFAADVNEVLADNDVSFIVAWVNLEGGPTVLVG